MKTESEFGKGLCYCLGLFLAHTERAKEMQKQYTEINLKCNSNMDWAEMWFNGAADHLFELEIPASFPDELKDRLQTFQSRCLGWRLSLDCEATPSDVAWSIIEAKELLRLIDEYHHIATAVAQWS